MQTDNIFYALNCLDSTLQWIKKDCRQNSNRYEWASNAQITLKRAREELNDLRKQ